MKKITIYIFAILLLSSCESQEITEGYKYKPAKVDQPGYGEKWYKKIIKETGDQFKYIGKDSH